MSKYFVMEYIYRDANNFKAFGELLLSGEVTESYVSEIKSLLDFEEYFVAEQIGIPILYPQLWKFSEGPTMADHAFHEFSKFRRASESDVKLIPFWGTTASLVETFRKTNHKWDCSLSVHGELF